MLLAAGFCVGLNDERRVQSTMSRAVLISRRNKSAGFDDYGCNYGL
jgi:hypothetical protein